MQGFSFDISAHLFSKLKAIEVNNQPRSSCRFTETSMVMAGRAFTACLIGLSLLTAIIADDEVGTENEHEFSYLRNSSRGPEHWGSLKEEWKLCSIGKFQSPIDITEEKLLVSSEIGKLVRKYAPAPALIRNRGHDIMVEWNGYAGGMNVAGKMYNLLQCHWHTPSEHTIKGRRYDLELHMVHRSSEGETAVIAILYALGRPDYFLNKVLANINDSTTSEEEIDLGVVNPWEIKFGSRKHFRYWGSLTVPPCTQGVLWTLQKKVRTASREQITALREAVHDGFEDNARPLQPLNDRNIFMYRPGGH